MVFLIVLVWNNKDQAGSEGFSDCLCCKIIMNEAARVGELDDCVAMSADIFIVKLLLLQKYK